VGENLIRQRLRVRGVVQGVGFRPFVFNLATHLRLAGLVGNDGGGVFIEVEGTANAVAAFVEALKTKAPPLARIDTMAAEPLAPTGDSGFAIVASTPDAAQRTLVAPDLCLCDDCRRELLDPSNRRYRYPFINCTNCGPRFTITQRTPYDRPATTMAGFAMCADCAREYADPQDRRFHAQPNACPVCGPQVVLDAAGEAGGMRVDARQAGTPAVFMRLQQLLAGGAIVAVKGIGGYHLACDAAGDAAVDKLRARKGRVDKPFAVMAANLDVVRQIAFLDDEERALLTSPARPIVLLRKRDGSPLSPLVAPGNGYVGVMLPYTPLHELLFHPFDSPLAPRPSPLLVLTSGNRSDEPIAWEDEAATVRLAPLADAFLRHDRPIHVPCDDSVMRVFAGNPMPLRRARGFAPLPVSLPHAVPAMLAVGGELKATFCLAAGEDAFLSQHIGDLENLETLEAFARAVDHFRTLFRIEPEVVVCDAHPGYLGTRWAEEWAGSRRLVRVQHHHAHVAALMAEHRLDGHEPLLGFSFDGTGYGADGAIWGGEVLLAGYGSYERMAHLRYVPLPGGDAAVRRPYRTALAHLWAAGIPWHPSLPPVAACPPAELRVLRRQLETGFNCVPTSSMGRLFDAVAALAGVRQQVSYEAQAAIELEALARPEAGEDPRYKLAFAHEGSTLVFDASSLLAAVVEDVTAGRSSHEIASRFHQAVASLVLDVSLSMRARLGIRRVGLTGGVFQNVTLLASTVARLQNAGFEPLVHRLAPPNDGGLALGQVMVAAAGRTE
jgi:hydrogenase maturation protein HypF